jgi:hypothetical protein
LAPIDTTFSAHTAKGLREDLIDVIYNIAPTETPVMSNIGRGTAKAVMHQWQTDTLASPDINNAVPEGDDIDAFPAATPTVRVANYTQISRKLVLVSGSLEAVDKAGRNSEIAYQLSLKSAEIKRDMESMILQNGGGTSGNTTSARKMAGLLAWIKTNVNMATDGVNPTWTADVPLTSRTDGTARAISETLFKDVIAKMYASGARTKGVYAGPINKQNISKFKGIATPTYYTSAPKAIAIIGAADVYVSDFGTYAIVPSRFQRERDVWFLDEEMLGLAYLRPFQTIALAKSGDAEKRMLLTEYTLKVNNEAAHGLLADLDTVLQ